MRVQDEVAGIKAVLAAAEIRRMKARIADKLDAHAARGLPPGSRGYGYVHGRDEHGERTYLVVPEQAECCESAPNWCWADGHKRASPRCCASADCTVHTG